MDDLQKVLLDQLRQMRGGQEAEAANTASVPRSMQRQLQRLLGGDKPSEEGAGDDGEPADDDDDIRLEAPLYDPAGDVLNSTTTQRATAEPDHPKMVFDFRHGRVPDCVDVVGDHTLEKMPDGSTAVNLDSMSFLRVNTPLFAAMDAKKISSYTITMDVMMASVPAAGLSLYQTAFPEVRDSSEATLNPDGNVGSFGKFGKSAGLFKPGKWNRIVITVSRSAQMTTYVNGTQCVSIKEEMESYARGGRDRFSLCPLGFHLFVPDGGRLIEGGLLVRYVSVDATARSSSEVKRANNVDTIFNQFEKELREDARRQQRALSLEPIYKDQAHPMWMDPAFLSEFMDAMIEGSGLEGASSYFSLAVFEFVLQAMVKEQAGWLKEQLDEAQLVLLQKFIEGIEPSIQIYRRFRLAQKGPGQLIAFVTFLVAQLDKLEPGSYLMVPGGYRNKKEAEEMVYLVHCVAKDDYRFGVVSLGAGLAYHPSQAQEAPKIKYKTVVTMNNLTKGAITDAAWWTILLSHFCCPTEQCTAKNLYGTVFPWLCKSTWESQANAALMNPGIPWRTTPRSQTAGYKQFVHVLTYFMADHKFKRVQAKCVTLNLRRQFMKFVANDLTCVKAVTSSDVKILRMSGQQLAHCAMKFHKCVDDPNQYLQSLLSDVKSLEEKVASIPVRDAGGLAPPEIHLGTDLDQMTQHSIHPLMERLLRKDDVDGLAGDKVPIPDFVSIDFTQLPLKVTNFEEALTALRFTDKLCTLISVQSHIVKNSNFLKVALLQYVFNQLVPVPAGPNAGRPCVWQDTPMRYGVQLDIVILLVRIMEHFAAAAFSLQTTRSFDAVRIVTSGAMVAIADCVLRKAATDHPSEFCLALMGDAAKRNGFGVGMGLFAEQSETIEATSPELNITRTSIMDYFSRVDTPTANVIFKWEESMKMQHFLQSCGGLLSTLCKGLAFPMGAQEFLSYLVDSHDLVIKNYPEFQCYRDLCFYWKYFMCTDLDSFPSVSKYTQRNAELQWGLNNCAGRIIVKVCGAELSELETEGHRFPSGALAAAYVRPNKAFTEDDILHIHSFACFEQVLDQKDIELLLSFLTVPYMRVPLVLGFLSSGDRIHALREKALRELVDAVLFEPSRYLELGCASAPTMIPSEDKRFLATPYGLLLNELHRSPKNLVSSLMSLLKQARMLDTGTVYSTTVKVILYVVRLCARIENAMHFFVSHARGKHPTVNIPLRDFDVTKEILGDVLTGLADLQVELRGDATACPHGSVHSMIENWLYECWQKMSSLTTTPDAAAEDDSDTDDDEADSDEEDVDKDAEKKAEERKKKRGGSGKVDRHTRLSCRLYAHLLLLYRNVNPEEYSVVTASTLLSGFIFLQTRHTWNQGLLPDVPETELYELMQVQRRNMMHYLATTAPQDVAEVMESVVRVTTAMGIRRRFTESVIRPWGMLQGPRNCCRFTLSGNASAVRRLTNLAELRDAIRENPRVVVDVFASWCGPCKAIAPFVRSLAAKNRHIAFFKVNIDEATDIAEEYGVRSIPTFLFFSDNTHRHTLSGANPQELERHVDRLSAMEITGIYNGGNSGARPARAALEMVDPDESRNEEVNLHTFQLSLLSNHLKSLDEHIQGDFDVQTVFETKYPMQCAVQETAKNRDCVRLLGRLHDVHYWKTPDQTTALQVNDREYDPGALAPTEQWIRDLFEPVRLKFFNDPMNPIQFVLPERELPVDAWVGYLTAIHPERGGTWKEVFVLRNWNCVQIYDVISYGRRQYRSLCYSTDARYSLRELQPATGDRRTPWPAWGRYEAGDPTADLDPGVSAVIFREYNANGNISEMKEQFIPSRMLYGLIPSALLETHQFWQDEADNLRGYPLDTNSDHYLMVNLVDHEGTNVCFTGCPLLPAHCTARIRRISSQGEMTLLNLAYSLDGTALHSMARTLSRIENLGHILAWTKSSDRMVIDLVQLPRLKLTFVSRPEDGEDRLFSVDHADLFITNDHTELALQLIRGMPHCLLMANANKDITVLLPCIRTVRPRIGTAPFSTELVMDRASPEGTVWRSNLETPYYLYPVHVSMSFLQAPTLSSALYLLLQRFQFRDYHAVTHLVDSIATDTDFSNNKEEVQIFRHLGALNGDAHPDAHAVRAKISIVMMDSPVVMPWDLPEEVAKYITKLAHVSATTQLSLFEQVQCLEECENIEKKTETILEILREYKPEEIREILKFELDDTAALEATFQDKKKADQFFETVFDRVFRAVRLRMQKPEALRIIVRILQGVSLSEFFKCLLFNRRKFVDVFVHGGTMAPCKVPAFGKETKWVLHFNAKAVTAQPNHWAPISLLHTSANAIAGPMVIETLMNLWQGAGSMSGAGSGMSFLFLYNLFSGETKFQLAKQQCSHTFASMAAEYFNDYHQDSLMASIISILVHNPQICSGLPRFKDNRATKTDEITCDKDEDGNVSPLHTLFAEIIAYLQKNFMGFNNYGSKPPQPMTSALPTLPVPKGTPLEYIKATNIPYANLKLPTDTQGYVPTLSNTACPFMFLNPVDASALPLDADTASTLSTTNKDLDDFAGAQLQSVQLDQFVRSVTRAELEMPAVEGVLPFDVSHHPYANSHVAQQMLKRLTVDMQSHAKNTNENKVVKVVGLSDADVEKMAQDTAATAPVLANLAELERRLVALRDKDKNYVAKSIPAIESCANFVYMDPAMVDEDMTSRLLYELRRYCGQETKMWLEYLVGSLLSDCDKGEWKKLNPMLASPDFAVARNLVISMLLHANRVGHANRAIIETRDLIKLVRRLNDADAATKLKTKAAILQKADSLAQVLTAARHYVDRVGERYCVDPRFLVFEFTWNIVLRKSQIEMVNAFIQDLKHGKNSVWQMVMGAGKTTVVSPLLCMFLADGKQMVMQVMPNALLEFSRGVLRSTFSSIVHKRIYTFHYDRSTQCDPALYRKLQTATVTAGIVVTNPTSVKSLMLKLIETYANIVDDSRPRTRQLEDDAQEVVRTLQLFRKGALMMDEVDLILHPLKSELNFPIGPKELLDFAPMRWTLPIHILDAMFYAELGKMSVPFQQSSTAMRILDQISVVLNDGVQAKAIQRIPHIVLLDADFYHHRLKPLLAEWTQLWLEHHNFAGLDREQTLSYLLHGPHKDAKLKELVLTTLADRSKQMLNLAHDWLTSYLPHALQKIDRVTFGLMTPEDKKRALAVSPNMPRSRFMLAIPFVGKDVPSDSSEFAHPDIIIGLTILGYRYEGMRYSDFKEVIISLRENAEKEPGEWKDRKSNVRYETWVREAGGEIRGRPEYKAMTLTFQRQPTSDETKPQVSSLRLLKQSSREHMYKLYKLFRRLPQFIHYYLNEFIFPTYMRHQTTKLSASGQELGGDALFPRRVGFSGTPSDLLPVELGNCNYEVGTDGFLIDTLTNPRYVTTTDVPNGWSPQGLLKFIATEGRWHSLIDTGALITGMNNFEVAKFLLDHGLGGIDGVVFLDDKDRKVILVRATGRVLKLEECGIPLDRRFAFYDQIHTTGMDIKHTPNAEAILTLGKDMTFRDFSQGAFRMRGITRGQTINIFVIPEVKELMCRELRTAKQNIPETADLPLRLQSITAWLVINSMGSERLQFNQLCIQNVQNVYRKKAFTNLLQGNSRFRIGENVMDDHCLGPSLNVFHEPVEFSVESGVPEPRKFTDTINHLLEDKMERFISTPEEIAVIEDVRSKVRDLVDDYQERAFNQDMVQEQVEEKEQERENVQEKELEITQFKDLQYSRENEEPVAWPVRVLGSQGHTGVFYPAADFKLYKQQPIHFPGDMLVSNNYFQPAWSGARRVKNIVVTMEWIPSRRNLTVRDTSKLLTGPSADIVPVLERCLQLFSGTSQKLTKEQLKKLMCAAFDRAPKDAVLHQLVSSGATLDLVAKIICDNTMRVEEDGRYSVCLSLIEAESIRRVMHVRSGMEFLHGTDTSVALRLLCADNIIMDESHAFSQTGYAPLYQTGVIFNSFRFMDCEMYFKDSQLNALLRGIQRTSMMGRRVFFDQIIGCKRRKQKEWESKPVSKTFALSSEFNLLHQRVQGMRLKDLILGKGMELWDAFQKFDYSKTGALTPGSVLAAMRWVGLAPTHDDVVDFVATADPSGNYRVRYDAWLEMLADPEDVVEAMQRQTSSCYADTDDASPPSTPINGREDELERIPPVDEAELMTLIAERKAHQDVVRQQQRAVLEHQEIERIRELRRFQIQRRKEKGLQDNPRITSESLYFMFDDGCLPDDITASGYTEYVHGNDGKQYLRVAPQSVVNVPIATYGDPWCTMGVLDEYTLTMDVRVNTPSNIRADVTLPEDVMDQIENMTPEELMTLPPHILEEVPEEILETLPPHVIANKLPNFGQRRRKKKGNDDDEDNAVAVPLVWLARHRADARVVSVRHDGAVVVDGVTEIRNVAGRKNVVWEYLDPHSGEYRQYGAEQRQSIERQHDKDANGKAKIQIGTDWFYIDFKTMVQQNASTGGRRQVRRVEGAPGSHVSFGEWAIVSIVVSASAGTITTYVNGELSAAYADTTISAGGPCCLSTKAGFGLFGDPSRNAMTGGEIKSLRLIPRAVSELEVIATHAEHMELNSWQCGNCTYLNKSGTSMCSVCNFVRSSENLPEWNCQVCTYLNPGNNTICEVCNTGTNPNHS
eukprot:PhM_4_TR11378/c0_g1_i1/m.4426